MAFGVRREELDAWKKLVSQGEIAYLTHYWLDARFPGITTVTKVGCNDPDKLVAWCVKHGLDPRYIHNRSPFPHFDLIGPKQREILEEEQLWDQLQRFRLI
ncbi:MAG TPA: hypothetical protein VGN02_07580 [Paenibacillus sp.]|jgi:hypothetical protein|uniref:hypothetical protein n=1 Tax=Paenibacillus sp. D2_2 TaxID=3073092 RepID=UPI0028157106|nr:hypothetical protein [Paenibacillus sp. D2_2]WMT40386.1 hypothetical protein RE628_24775 [Paenibacillus sp. D2_2]